MESPMSRPMPRVGPVERSPLDDGLGRPAKQQCRKRPAPSSGDCQPGTPPMARKRPRREPATTGPTLDMPERPEASAGMLEPPPAPTMAATPGRILVMPNDRGDTTPLHGIVRYLQARLKEWEEAVLPEAGWSLLRRKWRGMGMIQHKARKVRQPGGRRSCSFGRRCWMNTVSD